jgi:hypothetical protein
MRSRKLGPPVLGSAVIPNTTLHVAIALCVELLPPNHPPSASQRLQTCLPLFSSSPSVEKACTHCNTRSQKCFASCTWFPFCQHPGTSSKCTGHESPVIRRCSHSPSKAALLVSNICNCTLQVYIPVPVHKSPRHALSPCFAFVTRSEHKENYGCNAMSYTSTATTPPPPWHLRTLLCVLPYAMSMYKNRMVYATCASLLLVSCLAQSPGLPASNFTVNWHCMHHSYQAALTYALNKSLLWPPTMAE